MAAGSVRAGRYWIAGVAILWGLGSVACPMSASGPVRVGIPTRRGLWKNQTATQRLRRPDGPREASSRDRRDRPVQGFHTVSTCVEKRNPGKNSDEALPATKGAAYRHGPGGSRAS